MNFKTVEECQAFVDSWLAKPAVLRGRAWARQKAASECSITGFDQLRHFMVSDYLGFMSEIGQARTPPCLG